MALRDRLGSPDGRAWIAVAALLAAGSLAVAAAAPSSSDLLDWQPARLGTQPWRAWTAAWVHLGTLHLAANLGAAALLAMLGRRARLGPREAMAWALAWPLTHALLSVAAAAWPGAFERWLPHLAGMSGVLHAGVAVAGLALATRGDAPLHPEAAGAAYVEGPDPRRARLVGRLLLAGLAAKLLAESPWDLAPRLDPVLGLAVAPAVHASGALAGAACWLLARRRARHPGDAPATGR